jgi:hypothetical protein
MRKSLKLTVSRSPLIFWTVSRLRYRSRGSGITVVMCSSQGEHSIHPGLIQSSMRERVVGLRGFGIPREKTMKDGQTVGVQHGHGSVVWLGRVRQYESDVRITNCGSSNHGFTVDCTIIMPRYFAAHYRRVRRRALWRLMVPPAVSLVRLCTVNIGVCTAFVRVIVRLILAMEKSNRYR